MKKRIFFYWACFWVAFPIFCVGYICIMLAAALYSLSGMIIKQPYSFSDSFLAMTERIYNTAFDHHQREMWKKHDNQRPPQVKKEIR